MKTSLTGRPAASGQAAALERILSEAEARPQHPSDEEIQATIAELERRYRKKISEL